MDFKRLLKKIKKNKFCKRINNFHILNYPLFLQLFNHLQDIHLSISFNSNLITYQSQPIHKDNFKSALQHNLFTSKNVQKNILNTFHFVNIVKYNNIRIEYYSEGKLGRVDRDKIKNMIQLIMLFKKLYKREESDQIIVFFPTKLKKTVPKDKKTILGPNECNSGVTMLKSLSDKHHHENGEITIFRDEEHMKVLIHELIHANYRDLMLIKHMENKEFTNKFCTDYDILLNESYTEWLATILNIFYIGIIKNKSKKEIEDMIQKEVCYSIDVYNRIMNYYQIDKLSDIVKINNFCKKKLNQKTNVISYYLFKPLQFLNMDLMHHFLQKYTKNLQIDDIDGVQQYKQLILSFIQNENNLLRNHLTSFDPSLRMTLFEL